MQVSKQLKGCCIPSTWEHIIRFKNENATLNLIFFDIPLFFLRQACIYND